MAKTSEQLYQDLLAVDSSDLDETTRQRMLKKTTLVAANLAAALETINVFVGGPEVTPTAASLYIAADAISSSDRDPSNTNALFKELGLVVSKLAMETEAIRTGMGPQAKTHTCETSFALTSAATAV